MCIQFLRNLSSIDFLCIYQNILLLLIYGLRPDIRQAISGILPFKIRYLAGYRILKRPDYPTGYPTNRISGFRCIPIVWSEEGKNLHLPADSRAGACLPRAGSTRLHAGTVDQNPWKKGNGIKYIKNICALLPTLFWHKCQIHFLGEKIRKQVLPWKKATHSTTAKFVMCQN